MFNWIKEYCRKKYISGFKRRKENSFINLNDVASVGFVYGIGSAEAAEELLQVCRFFKSRGVQFRGLAVETAKDILEKDDKANGSQKENANAVMTRVGKLGEWKELDILTYRQLSWVGLPDERPVKAFFSQDYDLFINFNDNGNFTLDYIFATYVESPMRVGMVNDDKLSYNIVMQGKEKEILPVLPYLEQIFHYLNLIQTK